MALDKMVPPPGIPESETEWPVLPMDSVYYGVRPFWLWHRCVLVVETEFCSQEKKEHPKAPKVPPKGGRSEYEGRHG